MRDLRAQQGITAIRKRNHLFLITVTYKKNDKKGDRPVYQIDLSPFN
jgi:hypothetical protein